MPRLWRQIADDLDLIFFNRLRPAPPARCSAKPRAELPFRILTPLPEGAIIYLTKVRIGLNSGATEQPHVRPY